MTHHQIFYCAVLFLILAVVTIFDFKYNALKDEAVAEVKNKPFSFSRVQLSWWTVIVCSSFIACVFVFRELPNLDPSLLFLLGIAGGTGVASKVIDAKNFQQLSAVESAGFFSDILNKGDIHRLQALIFNSAIGVWFVYQVALNLNTILTDKFTINMILPSVPNYILALLFMSNALYLGNKTSEQ